MQTFLAYSDYAQSAAILDNKRLFKQLIEAKSILKANATGKGWIHHPITKAWRGYSPELAIYTLIIAKECVKRGIKVSLENEKKSIRMYYVVTTSRDFIKPLFVGNELFHASHRSNLLRKGRADAVCAQLKEMYRPRSINTWLKHFNFPEKSALKISDIETLEIIADNRNKEVSKSSIIERPDNYYKQFGWTEPDNLSYVWTM